MTPPAPAQANIGFAGDSGTAAEWQRVTSEFCHHHNLDHVNLLDISSLSWEAASATLSALLVVPDTATWARSRHRRPTGPQPLRNASWPWGFPWLEARERSKVDANNDQLRLTFRWMNDCIHRHPASPIVFIHPEDLGIAENGHPASIWQLPELRLWANKWGLKRYGTYQCNFGDADWPHPVGVLSTHPLPHSMFTPGWPILDQLTGKYLGPLPRQCSCPPNKHKSEADLGTRALRHRSSSLLQIDFLRYLASLFIWPPWYSRSRAKLCRKGLYHKDLVRAEENSDSDETDAGQAEVNWRSMDSAEPHLGPAPPQATLDHRALVALGIDGDYPLWNRRQDSEGPQNSKGVDYSEEVDMLQADSGMKGLGKSGIASGKGFVAGGADQNELRQHDVNKSKEQVKKKTAKEGTEVNPPSAVKKIGRRCEPD